ncbi:MAG TPA: tetratricopeptide repeat protein [Actinophytocola sp.]|nr:tetratricopeptide repeat protein [Actinophytocola sp.]
MALPPAVHRTIVVVDVTGFGDKRRTNRHQIVVRQALYEILARAFGEAGVSWAGCDHEDRGDGVLVIVPATVAKGVFVEALPGRLLDALDRHNRAHPAEERIRLRLSLHAGEIHYDDHGVVGRAVNLAFRLLDSPAFRDIAARSTGTLAVIASSWFFDEVIWHSAAADPTAYQRIRIVAKETDTVAWVRLPGTAEVHTGQSTPPRTDRQVPHQLPPSTRQFVGRLPEIDRLTRLLDEADPRTLIITAIDGTAGIGKTALAMTWAHQVADRFPDGQLHVNLRGFDEREPMDPGQALHGFLQALGVPPAGIPADLDAKTALYRSLLADRRMLVVLDNARSSEHVRPLLPGSETCVVITTSRNRMDSLMVRDGAHRIALDVLAEPDAVALLTERVGRVRVDAEPRATAELLDLCVRLPLALSIAAARAASRPGLSMTDLVGELRDERSRLDALDLGEVDLSLRAVFSWSYTVLSPAAARLFRLLGVHPGPDATAPACRALAGAPADTALRELVGAHLLTEHVPGRFRFHDLLHAYAVELAADEPERAAAVTRLVEGYRDAAQVADRQIQLHRDERAADSVASGDYAGAMAWFTAEHLTLLALIEFAGRRGLGAVAWQLAQSCNTFLRRTGRSEQRAAAHRSALAAARRSEDRAGEAHASHQLAAALARLGHHDEALDLLATAAEIYRELPDETGAFDNHLTYARVLEAYGRPADALEHARAAWELVRDGDNRCRHADALKTMGRQLFLLERHDEALQLCTRALDLYSTIGQSEGEADVLLNLGDLECALGRHENAVAHYRRSIELDHLLGDRYWAAIALERLGDTHRLTGDDTAATTLLTQSVALLHEIRHPEEKRVRAKLGAEG